MEAASNERLIVERGSRVQLRAIFSGVAVALGALALCLALSWAIGLSTFAPTAERARGLAIGLLVWSAAALAISVFVGAFVAALVGRSARPRDGVLHGLVVWGSLAAFLCLTVMGLFAGVMHDLLIATGGNLPGRVAFERGPILDSMSRTILVQMAHEAANLLWIFWAGLVAGLATSLLGGWLGWRAEQELPLRRAHKVRAPVTAPTIAQPT